MVVNISVRCTSFYRYFKIYKYYRHAVALFAFAISILPSNQKM